MSTKSKKRMPSAKSRAIRLLRRVQNNCDTIYLTDQKTGATYFALLDAAIAIIRNMKVSP